MIINHIYKLYISAEGFASPTFNWADIVKNIKSPQGGRKGEWRKKGHAARPWGPEPKPRTYPVLGKGPHLHAMGGV